MLFISSGKKTQEIHQSKKQKEKQFNLYTACSACYQCNAWRMPCSLEGKKASTHRKNGSDHRKYTAFVGLNTERFIYYLT